MSVSLVEKTGAPGKKVSNVMLGGSLAPPGVWLKPDVFSRHLVHQHRQFRKKKKNVIKILWLNILGAEGLLPPLGCKDLHGQINFSASFPIRIWESLPGPLP